MTARSTRTPDALMRPEVLAQPAYQVADATGLIKLDAMENPHPWPGALEDAWLEALRDPQLNRYPDAQALGLAGQVRAAHGVPEAAGLMFGNGSDELIQILITAIAGSGRPVLAPEPTFVMYGVLARALGVPFVGVPLNADFTLDLAAMREAMAEHNPAVVFLAYPNNPTGTLDDAATVEAVVDANPGVTVFDEAYAPFAAHSFLSRVGADDGLMVMRTVSKLGLAGARLGYLAGTPAWIDALDRLRLPYNINTLTQRSVAFALEHRAALDAQARGIVEERGRLTERLAATVGVERVFPSQANFILFRVRAGQGHATFAALRAAGILIKDVGRAHPLLADCLRVTVGRPDENDAFLGALGQALST
ncbi:histidinol-phosphate transaminase [Thioalkalivibrio sp. ALJ1]|uniref:histidinol-phosphate transaminase n=1 Tax=Thioalkalivibrio sp. ALJ1 TaxID=1158144 RepID=UPI0009DD0BAC|nr:histidinol-phosphate transaminase [Thioalkalivibrio sp. ALJ1]